MRHPDPNTILKLVKKLEPYKDCTVKMGSPMVDYKDILSYRRFFSYGNLCGCHGAWWAKAFNVTDKFREFNYRLGANELARRLGFENLSELQNWAFYNKEIWGNEFGNGMFCSRAAFNEKPEFKVQVLIDKWKDVAKRIKEESND